MKKTIFAAALLLIGNEIISLAVLCVLGGCGVYKLFEKMAERGVY